MIISRDLCLFSLIVRLKEWPDSRAVYACASLDVRLHTCCSVPSLVLCAGWNGGQTTTKFLIGMVSIWYAEIMVAALFAWWMIGTGRCETAHRGKPVVELEGGSVVFFVVRLGRGTAEAGRRVDL